MKNLVKLACMTLVICLAVSFIGCSSESAPTKEIFSSNEETSSVETQNENFALNETAVFENLKITAIEMKESVGEEYFGPESGNIFVGVKFRIENISDEEQAISSLLLFSAYCDSIKCDYSISAAMAFDNGTLDGTLDAGKIMEGWYSVEVPSNWAELELQVQSDWLSNSKAAFIIKK